MSLYLSRPRAGARHTAGRSRCWHPPGRGGGSASSTRCGRGGFCSRAAEHREERRVLDERARRPWAHSRVAGRSRGGPAGAASPRYVAAERGDLALVTSRRKRRGLLSRPSQQAFASQARASVGVCRGVPMSRLPPRGGELHAGAGAETASSRGSPECCSRVLGRRPGQRADRPATQPGADAHSETLRTVMVAHHDDTVPSFEDGALLGGVAPRQLALARTSQDDASARGGLGRPHAQQESTWSMRAMNNGRRTDGARRNAHHNSGSQRAQSGSSGRPRRGRRRTARATTRET